MPIATKAALTPSEETVMRYHVSGLSREEIAAAMCVSHHTVRAHLDHAREKLSARNMAQAGARYMQTQLLRARRKD